MEVYVDGNLLADKLEGDNLQDVLNDLMLNRLGGERTLKEVLIDGRPYNEQAMGPAELMAVADIGRLEVLTLESKDVALHFLSSAGGYLLPIMKSVEKVAELFRVADQREANEQYLQTLEGLQLFLQMISSSKDTLGLDFTRLEAGGLSADGHLDRLAGLVQELLDAQEKEDWVLLADILEYDLNEELRAWGELLPRLREQVLS